MDRLEKVIEALEKIDKECFRYEHSKCPYFLEDECRATSALSFLRSFAEEHPKETSITLENIDTDMNFHELEDKLTESKEKLEDAVVDCMLSYVCEIEEDDKYKKRVIEELWDMIQAGLELARKACISADEVMSGYSEYLEKFKK